MKIRLYALIAALALSGCSLQTIKQQSAGNDSPPIYKQGEFNRESVYELLVAELAGQKGQFELAMANYLKQARLTRDPNIAERATRVAQYLRNVGAITEAAELWIATDPENPEPYQISASILLHQKRYDEALPLVDRALEYDRPRMLAVIRSQIPEMSADVSTGYLSLFDEMLANNPNQADLLVTQGLLHKQQGNVDTALTVFEKALKANRNNVDAVAQKAELQRLQGEFRKALMTIEPALKSQPDNQPLLILKTQLLFQSGQLKQGVKEAKRILKQNGQDYQLKFYLALLMLENNQTAEAKELFEELRAQNENDTRPHFYLGAIAQQDGKIEKAIAHFEKVDDPATTFQAISRIATLLDTPEDRERLSLIISDVRKTRPDLASQLFTLQAEWLNLHDFSDEALILLEEAIARFEDDVSLLYTRAMLLEATDFDRAEVDLRRILDIEPNSSLALNALGYTLTVHTKRYEEAYQLISRALEMRPDDPAIIDSMGWVLFKLQRYDEAVEYLLRAYEAIPDGEVASHLIQAYWAKGDKDKALALLKQGLNKSPDNSHLQEAAQAIGAH
ncbi:tetratricopeptide repeat protein [Pontibacterium sp.]|uniref:tetratricopeptide repeat protein n=1 Tax=Pontibacterium sp. TaxID=2036026 RepID=UPI003564AFA7